MSTENVLGHVSNMVELINEEMPILSSSAGGGSTTDDFVRVGIDCTLSPLKPATVATVTTGSLYQHQAIGGSGGGGDANQTTITSSTIKRVVCSPDLPVFTRTPVVEEAVVTIDSAKSAVAVASVVPLHKAVAATAVVAGSGVTDKSLQCNVCHKVFMQKNAFQNHLRSHVKDSTSDGPFQCNYCSKSFTVPARLTRHYRTHTGEKPYKCEYCDKPFSVKENLSVHRRIHTKERPYKCDVCERAFEHSGKLHRHMRIHTGERPHKCSFCDKTFIQSGQLVIHIRTHTGEKPYVCKTCDKGFTCSKQLKVHTRTHTGEKPYSCDICGKSFGYNHVLKLHQVSHYGEKVYKCTICNDTFTSKKTLECHIKSHSENGGSGMSTTSGLAPSPVPVPMPDIVATAATSNNNIKDAACEGEISSGCGSDKENNKKSPIALVAAELLEELSDEPKHTNELIAADKDGKSDLDDDDDDEDEESRVMAMGATDVNTELNKLCQYLYPRLPGGRKRDEFNIDMYGSHRDGEIDDEYNCDQPPSPASCSSLGSMTLAMDESPSPLTTMRLQQHQQHQNQQQQQLFHTMQTAAQQQRQQHVDYVMMSPVRYAVTEAIPEMSPVIVSLPSVQSPLPPNDRNHLSLPPRKRSKMILKSMESTAKKEAQSSRYSSVIQYANKTSI